MNIIDATTLNVNIPSEYITETELAEVISNMVLSEEQMDTLFPITNTNED